MVPPVEAVLAVIWVIEGSVALIVAQMPAHRASLAELDARDECMRQPRLANKFDWIIHQDHVHRAPRQVPAANAISAKPYR